MFVKIRQWRRDSHDLRIIIEARSISRQAALNALAAVIYDRRKDKE